MVRSSKAKSKASKAKVSEASLSVAPGSEYLQNLANMYFADLSKIKIRSSSSDIDEMSDSEVEPQTKEVVEENQALLDYSTGDVCLKEGCKRKRRGVNCIHNFCFTCCMEEPIPEGSENAYCVGHFAQKVKKEQEIQFIKEGLNISSRKRSNFVHYEESFSDFQQTVTIWCVHDFFANKDFSGDIMIEAANAERRKKAMNRRRGGLAQIDTCDKGKDDRGSSTGKKAPADGSKRERDAFEDAQAEAWAVVREKMELERKEKWAKKQSAWIQAQKNEHVQCTDWLLK